MLIPKAKKLPTIYQAKIMTYNCNIFSLRKIIIIYLIISRARINEYFLFECVNFLDFRYSWYFMHIFYSNFCANKIIFEIGKRSFINFKCYFICAAKHKISTDPKSRKINAIAQQNMHLSKPLLVYQSQLREALTNAGCATSSYSYSCINLVSRSLSTLFI